VTSEAGWPDQVDPDAPPSRRSAAAGLNWRLAPAVAAGGFVGGLARYLVGRAWPAPQFGLPWDILLVNTLGCLVLGAVVVGVQRFAAPRWVRPLLGTGLCGGLTTFSSVAVAVDRLAAHGRSPLAGGYLALSLAAGLLAAAAGARLARVGRPSGGPP
jgi:CrcB protein